MEAISSARVLRALRLNDNEPLHLGIAAMLLEHIGQQDRATHLVLPLDAVEGRPVRPHGPTGSVPVRVTVHPDTRKPVGRTVRVERAFDGAVVITVDGAVAIQLTDGGDALIAELAPVHTRV